MLFECCVHGPDGSPLLRERFGGIRNGKGRNKKLIKKEKKRMKIENNEKES